MTKAELEEYSQELETAIQEAYDALQEDDADRATTILADYVGSEDEGDQTPQ